MQYTGLDPAGLLFRGDKKTAAEKLDAEDAEFVEVIHTNMGQLGLDGQIGHADFYPVKIIWIIKYCGIMKNHNSIIGNDIFKLTWIIIWVFVFAFRMGAKFSIDVMKHIH